MLKSLLRPPFIILSLFVIFPVVLVMVLYRGGQWRAEEIILVGRYLIGGVFVIFMHRFVMDHQMCMYCVARLILFYVACECVFSFFYFSWKFWRHRYKKNQEKE